MRTSVVRRTALRLIPVAAVVFAAGTVAPAWASAADGGTDGTTVDVSEVRLDPIPDGSGKVHASAAESPDPTFVPTLADDYREVEYLVSGVANTYSGPATGPAEAASTGNTYVTRVIARSRRTSPTSAVSVFLEPFNTTSGPDQT